MSEEMLAETFRQAMRRVPVPVTVVTVTACDKIRGITVGSFTSVSLDPPLISFNVSRAARMHGLITVARHFAVHLLSEDQAHLSTTFADPARTGAQQFENISFSLDEYGVPVLAGAMVVFRCVPHAVHIAGDHTLMVGRVLAITPAASTSPLVYFDRGYRMLGPAIDVPVWPF